MNRAEYRLHRAGMRNALGVIKRQQLHNAMADGTNCFQRQSEEDFMRPMRDLAAFHRARLPVCADSAGFRAMYRRWAERRARVEYRVRCRQHDAELLERHDERYGMAA